MGLSCSKLCRPSSKELEKWVIYIQDTEERTMTPVPWSTYDSLQNVVQSKWNTKNVPSFLFMDGTGVPKNIDDQASFSALIPRYLSIENKIEVYYAVAQIIMH